MDLRTPYERERYGTSYTPAGARLVFADPPSSVPANSYPGPQPSPPGWTEPPRHPAGSLPRVGDLAQVEAAWLDPAAPVAGGPLHVTDPSNAVHPMTRDYIKACESVGLRYNADFNGDVVIEAPADAVMVAAEQMMAPAE